MLAVEGSWWCISFKIKKIYSYVTPENVINSNFMKKGVVLLLK